MDVERRKFLKRSGLLSLISMFTIENILHSCTPKPLISAPMVFREDEGEVLYIGNKIKAKLIIKLSKTTHPKITQSLLTEIIPPGDYIPEHKHKNEDEFIFILRGKANVLVSEKKETLLPGDLALIPKNTWHGLKNQGNDYVHMLFGYSPAGFEDYFRAIGVKSVHEDLNMSREYWDRTSKKFGVVFRNS